MLSKEKVKSIKWYRQSGAGIPFCIGMAVLSIVRTYKKLKLCFPNDIAIFAKTNAGFIFYHYFDYSLTLKEVEKIFSILKTNRALFENLKDGFYTAGKEMEQVGLSLLDKKVNSKEFQSGYSQFFELTMRFWENSTYLDLLDPFENQIIDFIFGTKRRGITKGDLNILMSPDEISNFQKGQVELLKILKVVKDKSIKSPTINTLLTAHAQKYYWIQNDYEKVVYLDAQYYFKELQKLTKNPAEARQIAEGIKKSQKTKEQKKAIIKKYSFDKKTIQTLNFFNWVTAYRDDRKKFNQISNYVLIQIMEKLSKELRIDLELLKYAMPDEVIDIIGGNKKTLRELQKRFNIGVMVFTDKAKTPEKVSGAVINEYFTILEQTITASEIKGTTASPGKIIGTAKIILNQNDFSKMKRGDVIVASMTRPEYVSIMKQASAIVTDEGGITCHAAIVARELNIPCIIGTQNATRTLNDGDLIDVNADHGLVKIVRKNQ